MQLIALIEYLRQRLNTLVLGAYGLLGFIIILDALPFIVDKTHAHTLFEHWPAFWSLFGVAGCGVLVLLSKTLGHHFVSRQVDYYHE